MLQSFFVYFHTFRACFLIPVNLNKVALRFGIYKNNILKAVEIYLKNGDFHTVQNISRIGTKEKCLKMH